VSFPLCALPYQSAARDERIHAALERKVSRERVGNEIKKIFTSKRVSTGLRLIEEYDRPSRSSQMT